MNNEQMIKANQEILYHLSLDNDLKKKESRVQDNINIASVGVTTDFPIKPLSEQKKMPDLDLNLDSKERFFDGVYRKRRNNSLYPLKYLDGFILRKTVNGLQGINHVIGSQRISHYLNEYADALLSMISEDSKYHDLVITYPRAFMLLVHRRHVNMDNPRIVNYYDTELLDNIADKQINVYQSASISDILDTYYENVLIAWLNGILANFHGLFITKVGHDKQHQERIKVSTNQKMVHLLAEDSNLYLKFCKL